MHAAHQEDRDRRPGGNASGETRRSVFESAEIGRALSRIAHEILERTNGAADVVLGANFAGREIGRP